MSWSVTYGKTVPIAEYNNLCTRIDNLSASYTEKREECERLIRAMNAQRLERDAMASALKIIQVWAMNDCVYADDVARLVKKTLGNEGKA